MVSVQGYEIYNVNIQVDIVESASRKVQHVTMRERLIRTAKDDRYNDKWRRFILNVDQSPLSFAVCIKTTYELSAEEQHQIGLISLVVGL